MKTVLILGATGAVGSQLLAQALLHADVAKVVAPTRRPLDPHPKLANPIIDFEALPADAPWWQADIAFCALGTTLKQAGSAKAFYRVDHDYILRIAELTHAAGTPRFVLNSTLGAAVNGFGLYPSNLKILVQSCFGTTMAARCSSFLRTGLKALDAALALVALEQPKLPNTALPQELLSPAENASSSCLGIYLKTKGETERDVESLRFVSLTLVRPSLLDGAVRTDQRTGEAVGLLLNRYLGKLIPIKWRAISVAKVARMMLSAGLSATPGLRVIESAQIHQAVE